ncbi:MAG: CrcB family protein [Planctomycetaceae bacterium]
MIRELSLIAAAGAVGTLARFGLHHLVQRLTGSTFPLGTLIVNVLGCFLFGVVWILAEERMAISAQTRTIVLIGFMGAFTTFSTFAFDTGAYLRDSNWQSAFANLLLQNLLGITAIFAGFAAARHL